MVGNHFKNLGEYFVSSATPKPTNIIAGTITELDGAAPVLKGAKYQNAATGTLDVDKIVVTYSENITLNQYDAAD